MPLIDNELVSDQKGFKHANVSIGDYIFGRIQNNIRNFGDGLWMRDAGTGRSMKYSELEEAVIKSASAFTKRGLRTNDVVLLISNNFIEVPVAFFSVWKAGGCCACLTLNLFAEDIRSRIEEVGAKFVVTDKLRAERVVESVRGLNCVEEVFVIGQAAGCTPFEDLVNDDGQDCPVVLDVDLDSMAWLMYSSGTTGTPKGIVHTHRTIVSAFENLGTTTVSPGLKSFFINFMMNSGGMAVQCMFTVSHSEITVLSNFTHDIQLVEAIDKFKPMTVTCFPSQVAWICRHPDLSQYDFTSVRSISVTGSSIFPKYELEIYDKMPNLIRLSVAYGMSELLNISNNAPKVADRRNFTREKSIEAHVPGSVGKVTNFVSVKIIDRETGAKLGTNQVGEICAKNPFIMKGYFNNPKATAETIVNGWVHTGDQGYYDENENLFIVGRYKELIKYRMAHVTPINIEKEMMTHPDVEDVGVIGLPDEVDGELPMAFVVLRLNTLVTAEELVNYTNERVIEEEKLRGGIRFIEEIPRNELGKIMRQTLKKLICN